MIWSLRRKAATSPYSPIAAILAQRLLRPSPHASGVTGTVTLDAGPVGAWTVRLQKGAASLIEGRVRNATATVKSDPSTLLAMVEGTESGLSAFLAGKLGVRGNVGLALKLDLYFPPPSRPLHFPRPGVVDVAGVSTFYLEAGEGPPVIFLHGLGATNVSMLPTFAALARDHRVIAPDMPGFGESSKPVRPLHAAYFARWLVSFLDALSVDRAHVVGNSMGGRVAIELALRAPDRADRLILLAPSMAWKSFRQMVPIARLLRPEMAVVPIPVPRIQVMTTLRMLFARPQRLPQTWLDAAADEFLHVFGSPQGRIAFFSAARQIYVEDASGRRGFWDRLPTLSRPALFIWGDKDWLVPHAFARHVVDRVPHATSVILDDCGHVPQYEAPDRVEQLAREFLGRS